MRQKEANFGRISSKKSELTFGVMGPLFTDALNRASSERERYQPPLLWSEHYFRLYQTNHEKLFDYSLPQVGTAGPVVRTPSAELQRPVRRGKREGGSASI